MTTTAPDVLDRNFLVIRAKLLEIGAALDRIDRGDGSLERDPRMDTLRRAIAILGAETDGRAEQIQMLFSLPYDSNWRKEIRPAPR